MSDRGHGKPSTKAVVLKLNQQQLELLDRTIVRGVAEDRAGLVRLALHEYAAAHKRPVANSLMPWRGDTGLKYPTQ